MKHNILKSVTTLILLVVLAAGCKDRNAEKRIAELESQLAELKGSKSAESHTVKPTVTGEAAATEKPEGPFAALSFTEKEFDFGTIKEGDVVEHTFSFKNTGEVPLIIQNAQPSCGCTVPDWTKEPIPVGGTGYVKAKFDSKGKPNLQQKTITVTANTFPKQTLLKFKAMVTPQLQEPPANGPRVQ